jgi:pimeloyl-ACP methyl ester carboxylesterase
MERGYAEPARAVCSLAWAAPRAHHPRVPIARVGELDIVYEERGDGEPLVLVAGIGMQLVGWPEGFLEALRSRGFRVIVFDNRDVGLSTKLDRAGVPALRGLLARALVGMPVRAPYTLFDMAGDVAGLLDALNLPRAHVVGASLGGMVAQAMAIAHGDRIDSLVSMMSHPGGGLLFVGLPHATMKLLQPPARSRAESVERQVDFFRTVGSRKFRRDDAGVAERAGRAYDRSYHPPGFARQFAAVLATGDMRRALRAVRAPTLVLHGSVDPIIRAAAGRETARAIGGAEFRLIDGWGHDLPEGAWNLLADAIRSHATAARRRAPGGGDTAPHRAGSQAT